DPSGDEKMKFFHDPVLHPETATASAPSEAWAVWICHSPVSVMGSSSGHLMPSRRVHTVTAPSSHPKSEYRSRNYTTPPICRACPSPTGVAHWSVASTIRPSAIDGWSVTVGRSGSVEEGGLSSSVEDDDTRPMTTTTAMPAKAA